MTTNQGITMGGGQITGLGGTGSLASNSDITSIAIGNSSSAAAVNAVALGTGASVTAGNSLALGAGATASQGAVASYTAFGLSGAQASTGELSIGASGATRQITNLAAGRNSTDAVNVGQLTGAASNLGSSLATALGGGATYNSTSGTVSAPSLTVAGTSYGTLSGAITALDGRDTTIATNVTNNTTAITNLQTGLANGTLGLVQQNAASRLITVGASTDGTRITVAGTAGTRQIGGLSDGSVASGSSDAVTGNQLYGTNQTVAANTTAIASNTTTIGNVGNGLASATASLGGGAAYNTATGTYTAPSFTVAGSSYGTVSGALSALDGRQTTTTTNVTNLQTGLANGTIGLVQQNAASRLITVGASTDGSRISVAGTAGTRQIGGVADGSVAAGSSDAVTGNQLFGTNQTVAANTAAIGTVATGLASEATSLGGGASYNTTTGVYTAPSFTVAGANYGTVSGALTALDGRQTTTTTNVTNNTTAITNLQTGLANGTLGLVQQNAASRLITVGASTDGTRISVAGTAGTRQIGGLSDGSVAAGSADAVTGNQLYGTNQTVAANTTAIAANTTTIGNVGNGLASATTSLGGGAAYNTTTGAYTAPSFTVAGSSYGTVSGALSALDGRQTTTTTNVTNLQTGLANGTLGLVQQNAASRLITVGASTDGTRVSVAGTAGTRQIGGVADGSVAAGSSDAVTGNQLFGTNQTVAANAAAIGTVSTGLASEATSLGGGASYNTTTGVYTAPSFTVAGSSYGTVYGALTALDGRDATLTTNVTNLQTGLANGTLGLVQQNATSRLITVGASTDGTRITVAGTAGTRQIGGLSDGSVAAGSADAVTGNQLYGTNQTVAANTAAIASNTTTIGNVGNGLASATASLGGGASYNTATGAYTAPSFTVAGSSYGTVYGALTALDGRQTTTTTNVTNLQTGLANGTLGLVQQNATSRLITVGASTDGSRISVAGTAGTRQIGGLSDGSVAAGSSDAVTGNQLYGTNQTVAANTAAIGTVASGLASEATSLGGGASYNTTTGAFTAPSFTVAGSSYGTVYGALTALDGRDATLTTTVTNLQTGLSNGTLGLVQQNATSRLITVGASTDGTRITVAGTAGTRQIGGLSDGSVAAGSADAVTGNQLYGTNQAVAANTAAIAANTTTIGNVGNGLASATASLGGGASYNTATGAYTAPSFTVAGSSYGTVSGALTALDGRDTALTTTVTNNTTAITNLQNGLGNGTIGLVQQNATSRLITVGASTDGSRISVAGTAGNRLIGGVAAGVSSDDAVTVGQLTTAIATVSGSGSPALSSDNTASAAPAAATGSNATAVGYGASATGARSVALGNGSVADQPDTVSVGSAGATRRVTHMADGSVASGSSDAVTGNQLYGTNQTVAANTAAIAANTTTIGNVGNGLASATASLGGGASYNTATSAYTAPSFTVAGSSYGTVYGALTALDGRDATLTTNVTNLQTGLSNGTLGLVQQNATSRLITVGANTDGSRISVAGTAGPRQIGDLADGSVAAGSSDAVTGNQLYGTNQAVAANTATIGNVNAGLMSAATSLGGGASYNVATGAFTAPTYTVAGSSYGTVYGALTALDGRETTTEANVTALQNGTLGLVQQNTTSRLITVGASTDGTRISVAGTVGGRQIGGVAAGTSTDDAVTVGQLSSALATVSGGGSPAFGSDNTAGAAPAVASGSNATAVGYGASATAARSVALGNGSVADEIDTVSVGTIAAPRRITHVGDGTVAAGSSDAVTGNQLFATNQAIAANTTTVGNVGAGLSAAAASLGGGASYNAATGAFAAPSYTVGSSTYGTVSGAITALSDADAAQASQIAALQQNAGAGLVRQNGSNGQVTVAAETGGNTVVVSGTAGARRLTGLGNGVVASGSTDAVTGDQLYAVNQALTTMTANVSALQVRITQGGTAAQSLTPLQTGEEGPFRATQDGGTEFPAATGERAVAGGYGATATDVDTTAVGSGSRASSDGSTALGAGAVATGDPTTAVGFHTAATGDEASAFGAFASATATNATALGRSAQASGANSLAVGMSATAQADDAIAIGTNANASGRNSVAIGTGAKATRANQVVIGSANHTYTLTGLASAASAAAQQGATGFVTTDINGNLAASAVGPDDVVGLDQRVGTLENDVKKLGRGVRQANEGVSIALAMGGSVLPGDKRYALSANFGTYGGEGGFAASGFARLTDNVALSGGVGLGTSGHNVAGRGGVTFSW